MIPRFILCCRVKYLFMFFFSLFLLNFFGVFTHMFEIDFYKDFHYPLDGDVMKYADQVRRGLKPDVEPINIYNYSYLANPIHKCKDKDFPVSPRLVIMVKSALANFKKRNAIRNSWGFEKRFSDVIVRTVFLLGTTSNNKNLKSLLDIEIGNYNDIVQIDFEDAYFNNTIKTVMGFRWAVEHCPRSRFYLFADDDYYISVKNVLRFVRNPVNYPEYLEEADETIRQLARKLSQSDGRNASQLELNKIHHVLSHHEVHSMDNKKHLADIRSFMDRQNQIPREVYVTPIHGDEKNAINEIKIPQRRLLEMELSADVKLFAGFVFASAPHRHKTSKWHVSLDEYPWHMWPPYVSAGAYILSREALIQLYYTSMFTKHFRFDDIFLGLVALKAQIEPLHSEEFHFQKQTYRGPQSYRYVVASHGYEDPHEMVKVWTETRAAGHA